MDLVRMTRSDIPALSPDAASELEQLTYETILKPLEAVLQQAHSRGEIITSDFALVAGGILGMIQSLFSVPEYAVRPSREQMGRDLVDAFLNGIAA
jgi:hypothetical protein